MPMMRRGPLDRYPAEWVLRQASAHQVSGSIEFHTSVPITFFLESGRVFAAERGVGLGELDAGTVLQDEGATRRATITLLTQALDAEDGWYYHDPLGHHPNRGSWGWEPATLLMETRANEPEVQTLAAWTDRRVALHETPDPSVTLGPDAWAIVVALAAEATASELRDRLGWNPGRLLAALTEIDERGVLDPERGRPVRLVPDPASSPAPIQTVAGRSGGPLSPPPTLTAAPDVQTALSTKSRRRLTGRRPGGS